MEVRAPVARRRVTLAEQLAASSNLRDLLKLRDDDEGGGGGRLAAAGRRRTLLDVIHDPDDDGAPAVAPRVLTAAGAGGTPASASARRERVSLMALLERTEQQWTAASGELWKRVDGEREEEEEEKSGSVGELCCVCVARDKGAAFIPCGHTFCRACARELRAGRGRCPLCNAAIREVLNLF